VEAIASDERGELADQLVPGGRHDQKRAAALGRLDAMDAACFSALIVAGVEHLIADVEVSLENETFFSGACTSSE